VIYLFHQLMRYLNIVGDGIITIIIYIFIDNEFKVHPSPK